MPQRPYASLLGLVLAAAPLPARAAQAPTVTFESVAPAAALPADVGAGAVGEWVIEPEMPSPDGGQRVAAPSGPRIEPHAPAVSAARGERPPPPPAATPVRAQTLAHQMRSYLRQVHARVGQAWAARVPPQRARPRVALVTITLDRAGQVVGVRLDRSSADDAFDLAALRVVDRPELFPPLPPYYRPDTLEVSLRFTDPTRPARP
jgi:TonB family protein